MKQKPKKIESLLDVVAKLILDGKYRETFHAQFRQQQRRIFLGEVLHVLCSGRHERQKDKYDEVFQSWNYAIRGLTLDEKDMRVIVSFDEEVELLIITAFYMDSED